MLEKLPESVGHALINQRAGMDSVLYNELFRHRNTARLELSSQAFVFNGRRPVRFTADGDGLSPPLSWDGVPREAESLALIVEDADSPTPHPLVHAIVVGLLAGRGSLDEGALNSPDHVGAGVETGQNSFFRRAWLPPERSTDFLSRARVRSPSSILAPVRLSVIAFSETTPRLRFSTRRSPIPPLSIACSPTTPAARSLTATIRHP